MSGVAHPNMFPVAGESVAIEASADAEPDQTAEQPAEPPRPADPWANPVGRLQRAAAPKAEEPKAKRQTRADQVVEFLSANGPTGSKQLCMALGLSTSAGITPLIDAALKTGRIVRVNHLYMLPDQRPKNEIQKEPEPASLELKAEAPASPAMARGITTQVTETAPPAAETARATPKARTPEFTISAGDALLIAWPDGGVTVQRGGTFVELTPIAVRLLRAFIELRT
ncbi:hypothetical protein ACFSHT_15735 [Paraburkholderia silviterrae]|uniref:Uncharacterized protein n=1 Tax=Paraburkholderia silviterrae TaxID=2528715 RepID=A0A4R5M9Q9_9BURK|nr:hypothetical protein [Paraburkholderia silviterrae]TDG23255.1 hypothetical protein EYW47_15095 [Paraburkholderia silviterrae]